MYSDLKNKTIFDFTDDPKIIDNIISETREEYLSNLTLDGRYIDLLELADLTNNKDLENAAEQQLAPLCMGFTNIE